MRKYLGLIAILASISFGLGLMSTAYIIPVNAQTPQFPNNTETATEFADVIEGNDTTTIENDTSISNTNNTLEDSTDVNINEDCMQVPGQSEPYCP
ncbi:MAG: hypothetical protein QN720_12350 [Nitrososphaeraceae archaeon]|jgi:hypothetical protein|nr:hypothetical protein [Nitrososphaeraceae archaeon]MDW0333730.1 hypothetical protein [Nitrososphaeraceae archaeon]